MDPSSQETVVPQMSAPEFENVTEITGGAVGAETNPLHQQQALPVPPINLPLPADPSTTPPQSDNASSVQAVSAVVNDDDVIEKDWVERAKKIVEANRSDPYKQSEQLTIFKAEYMKKRYGKDIKLST